MPDIGAIKIGGVSLNNSLQWTNRYQYAQAAQNVRRTLQGNPVVYSQSIYGARPITLEATEDTGWLQWSMVGALLTLAESPDTTYVFEFHGETYDVRFNYTEGPPIAFTTLRSVQVVANDEWMVGTIKLFTV